MHLQADGIKVDLLFLEENIEGDLSSIIGGNYFLKMTDKKAEIKISDFHKYKIIGNLYLKIKVFSSLSGSYA